MPIKCLEQEPAYRKCLALTIFVTVIIIMMDLLGILGKGLNLYFPH